MQEVVNSIAYIDGRRANVEIEQPNSEQKSPDRFVWVGLHEPSSETLKQYQKQFRLHDLAIEDAHNAHQRPKIETYGDILFIVLRTAQMNSMLIRKLSKMQCCRLRKFLPSEISTLR